MRWTRSTPEQTLAGFLHQHREELVRETVRAFFEASQGEIPADLRERKLEDFLRKKLAALEFDVLSGSLDHMRSHIRKSLQNTAVRSLGLATRLRLNLVMKRLILHRLSQTFEERPQELAAMRLELGRAIDEMLLELERSWRRRHREEGTRQEPILDAFFEATRGLASEQRFLETLIEQSPEAIVTLDKDRRIISWNRAAESITGYVGEQMVGQSFRTLLEAPKASGTIFAAVKESGQVQNQAVSARRREGGSVPISLSVSALSTGEEMPARYLCIFRDITEQVQAREQAIAMEKLSALASLSAAIAHEIRNPLNTLSLTIDVLDEVLQGLEGVSLEEVRPRLDVLREEIDQMSEITRTYLAMGRLPSPQMELKELTPILKAFAAQMEPELRGLGITLTEEYAAKVPPVPLDERQIRRVLHNLFRNAYEAMPEGGALRLRTWADDGDVKVELTDTGPGLPEEALEHLFVPFSTTKEGGTGLGLYLVREIIRAHRGSVSVENRPGGGCAVTLSIPFTRSAPSPSPEATQ